jgi:hypothetical protein
MRHSWFAPSTELIDAEDVLGHCRGKIMSFKLPRHVVFVDAFR